jgi:hypothetical protein
VIGLGQEIVRISTVSSASGRILRVSFIGDRREYEIDLTELFSRSSYFAPLLKDDHAFANPKVVENGLGVAWPIKTRWGQLDLSAESLRAIAERQQGSPS